MGFCGYHSGKNKRGNKGVNTVLIHKQMHHVFIQDMVQNKLLLYYKIKGDP